MISTGGRMLLCCAFRNCAQLSRVRLRSARHFSFCSYTPIIRTEWFWNTWQIVKILILKRLRLGAHERFFYFRRDGRQLWRTYVYTAQRALLLLRQFAKQVQPIWTRVILSRFHTWRIYIWKVPRQKRKFWVHPINGERYRYGHYFTF